MRIAVVEDERARRAGLCSVLESGGWHEVTAELAWGQATLAGIDQVDAVLYATRELGRRDIGVVLTTLESLPVVLVSDDAAVPQGFIGEMIGRTLGAGVGAAVLVAPDAEELRHAVSIATLGGWASSRPIAAGFLPKARRGRPCECALPRLATSMSAPLTKRELDVLILIASGDTNQRIARQLRLSVDTVKEYVTSILGKLGVDNRVKAARWAWQAGLDA